MYRLERWILEKEVYEVDSNDVPTIITAISFITLLGNWKLELIIIIIIIIIITLWL
jgi:hypothetical protein